MALVRIGAASPDKKRRLPNLGLSKIGTEVRSSFQRIGSSVGDKVTSTTRSGLQKIEGRVSEALQFDPFASQAQAEAGPEGELPSEPAPGEGELPPDPEALAAGYDQLEGLADYAGVLADQGRVAEARALVGALDTILKITRTSTMEVQGDRQAMPGQARPSMPLPPAMPEPVLLTPADEGPILPPEAAPSASGFVHVGQVWGGDSNAYNRFPGTVNPPYTTEPIFARPMGPQRIGVSPAFGPGAGLVVLPRRIRPVNTVEVVPEVMRRPGGTVYLQPRRSVPPFSWRSRR